MSYVELHASSAFSFLDGASLPEALIARAAALGYPALALLDRDGVGGLIDRLVGVFGRRNTCVALQRHLLRDEEADNHALRDLAAAYHVPIVATNGVRFAEPADRALYDVLTCIRHTTTLAQAGRR